MNLSGRGNVSRYLDMMDGVRKLDIERGAEVNSRIESAVAYDARGNVVHAPVADMEDVAKARHLHACRGMTFMTPNPGAQYVMRCDCGIGEHGPFRGMAEAMRVRDSLLVDGCNPLAPERVESKWHS